MKKYLIGASVFLLVGFTVANILPVKRGGTGAATLTNHGVVIGQGTAAVAVTSAGTSGYVLTSNGASADPTFQAGGGGGGSAKQLIQCNYPGTRFNAAQSFPLAGGFNYNGNAPSVVNGNVTTFSIAGTLKNWTLDWNATATHDTFIIQRSTDFGSTWTNTTLKIAATSGTHGADATHTVTVAADEWYSIRYTDNSDDNLISTATSCIEFDPN